MIVYSEKKSVFDYESNYEKRREWVVIDPKIIDSLKSEFKVDLNKQSDCYKCFITSVYKNGDLYDMYIFDNKKNYSFGKLKKKLIPVLSQNIDCVDYKKANTLVDSLNNLKILNVCMPDLTEKYHYVLQVKFSYKKSNDSSSSKSSLLNPRFDSITKLEFLKFCPELNFDQIYTNTYNNSGNAFIECNDNFILDATKWNGSDLIKIEDVLAVVPKQYTVTSFEIIKN